MKKKLLEFLFTVLVPILLALVLGLIFAAIASINGGRFLRYWGNFSKTMYFMFCAPYHVGALLRWLLKIDAKYAYGFGTALYYGTIFLGRFIGNVMIENEWAYATAFAIMSLICYLFWVRQVKEE